VPTTVGTIIAYVEELSGHPLYRDEGVKHGDAGRHVTAILVCWMATAAALAEAARLGCQMVLAHESLCYPYNATDRTDNPEGWQQWPTNRRRRELLERHGLVLLRVHGSPDEICLYDGFAKLLTLGEPVAAEGLAKVYEVATIPLAALAQRVKRATGLERVRISAPHGLDQVVRRIGLPWGRLGLFPNVGYQKRLIELGCDVLIAGESDDYGFRFSAECGIPMIETSHVTSENPGLERFCRLLRGRFPKLDVHYYACPPAWVVL